MSRSNPKLRIGIVGAGDIVRKRHLPALLRDGDVEISALSNSSYASAERFCAENVPGALPMQNWADLLALPDLDVIWIGTPPYMHSAVTVSALEAGKHVFCQARMSSDLAEAEEMLATSRRFPELVTMLCPPPYGMRGDLVVKKMLADEVIGRPHHVRLQSFHGNYLDPALPPHWRQRIEISGLNVMTLGIYVEVIQRWLGDITGVSAHGKVVTPVRDGYEVIVPDVLNILCTFANGAEGVLEFSGVHPGTAGDRLEIHGDAGKLVYDFTADTIAIETPDGDSRIVDVPRELEREWSVEDDFLSAVRSRGRMRPRPDFDEGVRYMRVVQAVADSRARQEFVPVKI